MVGRVRATRAGRRAGGWAGGQTGRQVDRLAGGQTVAGWTGRLV